MRSPTPAAPGASACRRTARKPLTRSTSWLRDHRRERGRRTPSGSSTPARSTIEAVEVVVLVVVIRIVMRAAGKRDRPRRPHRARAAPCVGTWHAAARTSLTPGRSSRAHPALDRRPVVRSQQVGLVQHDQVGGGELVLEQLLERAVVVERGIGRRAAPRQPPGRSANGPSRPPRHRSRRPRRRP